MAVAGLRRNEWQGRGQPEEDFRELGTVLDGMPLIGTGGLGSRVWSGPAITVIGIDVPSVDGAVNAVSPYARALLNVRVHPEQDAAEAQDAVIAHLRAVRPFGIELDVRPGPTGNGFAAQTDGPAYDAARAAWSAAWGADVLLAGSGGSIPIVSALAGALPEAEALLVGTTDGFANIHGPNERVLLERVRERGGGGGRVLRRVRRALAERGDDRHRQPAAPAAEHTGMARVLDAIERLGNRMPDPAILFLWLCLGVILLSQALSWLDVKATYEVVSPPPAPATETYYGGSVYPSYVGPTVPEPSRATTRSTRRPPGSRAC